MAANVNPRTAGTTENVKKDVEKLNRKFTCRKECRILNYDRFFPESSRCNFPTDDTKKCADYEEQVNGKMRHNEFMRETERFASRSCPRTTKQQEMFQSGITEKRRKKSQMTQPTSLAADIIKQDASEQLLLPKLNQFDGALFQADVWVACYNFPVTLRCFCSHNPDIALFPAKLFMRGLKVHI